MMPMVDKDKLEEVVEFLSREFWKNLKDKYIKGLGIGGSYARGDYSPSRPDINFIFFVNNDSPELYLIVSQTFNKVAAKYNKDFNLRPRSEPERPASSFKRKSSKPDVFIKISYLLFELKDAPGHLFGRPPFVAEAHASSFKLLYGKNYLTDISGQSSNEQVIKGSLAQFRAWNELLRYTPQSYRLPEETDLFFDESLAYGKLLVMQAAWIAGLKAGLDYSRKEDRGKIIKIVGDKEKLKEYLSRLGPTIQKNAKIILDARLNYGQWKNNLNKAKFVYKASFDLSKELLKIVSELK